MGFFVWEENPLLLQEAHAMQAIEHSMHSRHFPSEKQGGLEREKICT